MTTASPLPGGPFLHRGVLRLEGEGLVSPPLLLLPSPSAGVYRDATPFPAKKDTTVEGAVEAIVAEREAEREEEFEEVLEEGPWWWCWWWGERWEGEG